jgi:hypothetical protein
MATVALGISLLAGCIGVKFLTHTVTKALRGSVASSAGPVTALTSAIFRLIAGDVYTRVEAFFLSRNSCQSDLFLDIRKRFLSDLLTLEDPKRQSDDAPAEQPGPDPDHPPADEAEDSAEAS